jgi:hypothetical protein
MISRAMRLSNDRLPLLGFLCPELLRRVLSLSEDPWRRGPSPTWPGVEKRSMRV